MYYHAYTYVTKIDPHFKTSLGHPCLDNPLRADLSEAIYAKQRNAANKPQKSGPPKKQPRLDVEVLNDIVIKNKIRTDDEASWGLSIMFDCFFCPSNSKFNFVTAIDKEIIFFNDLRYGPDGKEDDRILPWNQFLNLLEGAPVNVAMPKNVNASDWEWTALQPIFAISDQRVVRIINGKIDYGETDQMNER